eukprot:Sro577_g169720.1 n/a (147) ;mRNA; r:50689-51129
MTDLMNPYQARSCLVMLLYNLGLAYDLQAKSGPVGDAYKCNESAIQFYQSALEAVESTLDAPSVVASATMRLVVLATVNNLARLLSLQLRSEELNEYLDWGEKLFDSMMTIEPLEEGAEEDFEILMQNLGPCLWLDTFVLPAAPAA